MLWKLDNIYTPNDVISILQHLDSPFSKLGVRSNKPQKIPANDFNGNFLVYLKNKLPEVISKINPEKDGYFPVFFKRDK